MPNFRMIGFGAATFMFGALLARGVLNVPVAQAEQARSAVCTAAIKPADLPAKGTTDTLGPAYAGAMAEWMNQQIAAGRTQFTVAPTYGNMLGTLVCAW